MQRLKDRVAVVTGGASGIGAASAASAFAFDAEDTDSVKALRVWSRCRATARCEATLCSPCAGAA